ncbi:MAG: MFS transporter [Thaumarchaeota archaeon]|nr:MFS transporter [Nitrososphaerota archaeon]
MGKEEFKSLIAPTVPVAVLYFLMNFSAWLWYALFGKYLVIDLGFSGEELGFVMMIYNLSFAISTFPAGRLSDMIGSKKVLFSGIIIYSIGILFMAYSLNAPSMAFACMVTGFGEGLFLTSATVHAVKSGGVRRVGTTYGFVLSAGILGEVLGSLMSGYVKEYLGSQLLFFASSAVPLISSPFIVVIREESQRYSSKKNSTGLLQLLKSHAVLRLMAIGLIFHAIGYNMISPFISVHAGAVGLSDKDIGIVNFTWLLSMFLTILPWSMLADRIGSKFVLAGHVFLSSISWITYAYTGDLLSLISAAVFMGIVGSMDLPSRRRLLAESAGGEGIGTLIGALDLFTMLSSIPAPIFGGAIYGLGGLRAVFWVGFVVNLIGVPFLLKVRVHGEG